MQETERLSGPGCKCTECTGCTNLPVEALATEQEDSDSEVRSNKGDEDLDLKVISSGGSHLDVEVNKLGL